MFLQFLISYKYNLLSSSTEKANLLFGEILLKDRVKDKD